MESTIRDLHTWLDQEIWSNMGGHDEHPSETCSPPHAIGKRRKKGRMLGKFKRGRTSIDQSRAATQRNFGSLKAKDEDLPKGARKKTRDLHDGYDDESKPRNRPQRPQ
jgi:hypothetical protein